VPWAINVLVNYPEYLVVQPGCSCTWNSPSTHSNHPGLVQTVDPVYFFAHGRVQLGGGKISLSRVAMAPYALNFDEWYITAANTELTNSVAKEVLVCETDDDLTVKPVLNFAGEACGVWTTNNYINSVTTIGFSAGSPSVAGTTAWVGRGSYIGEFEAGRFDAATGQSLLAYGAEQVASASEYLVVPQGCNCEWSSLFFELILNFFLNFF
jgi:hypothetical protein